MPTCCVSDCKTSYKNNPEKHSFHRFPINDAKREKWLKLIARPNWSPTKFSTVCSKHFEDVFIKKRDSRVMLVEGALPTLFVPVKIKPPRASTSYIYRDITLPLPPPLPCKENDTLSTKNIITSPKYSKLIQKLKEKQKRIRRLTAQTKRQARKIIRLQHALIAVLSQGKKTHTTNTVE